MHYSFGYNDDKGCADKPCFKNSKHSAILRGSHSCLKNYLTLTQE